MAAGYTLGTNLGVVVMEDWPRRGADYARAVMHMLTLDPARFDWDAAHGFKPDYTQERHHDHASIDNVELKVLRTARLDLRRTMCLVLRRLITAGPYKAGPCAIHASSR